MAARASDVIKNASSTHSTNAHSILVYVYCAYNHRASVSGAHHIASHSFNARARCSSSANNQRINYLPIQSANACARPQISPPAQLGEHARSAPRKRIDMTNDPENRAHVRERTFDEQLNCRQAQKPRAAAHRPTIPLMLSNQHHTRRGSRYHCAADY